MTGGTTSTGSRSKCLLAQVVNEQLAFGGGDLADATILFPLTAFA
jgi:hypothetical protein